MDIENVIKLLEEVGQEEIIAKLKSVSAKEQNDFVNQISE